jgi:hypothetical protein
MTNTNNQKQALGESILIPKGIDLFDIDTEEFVSHKISNDDIQRFMLAGKAAFTVQNFITKNRFTYKISKCKNPKGKCEKIWFVSVLTGTDNTSDYTFLGTLFNTYAGVLYKHSSRSCITEEAASAKVFAWLFPKVMMKLVPAQIEIFREGRCCRCGRVLTVPESIESGIGPECAKFM